MKSRLISPSIFLIFILLVMAFDDYYQDAKWRRLGIELDFMSYIIDDIKADGEPFPSLSTNRMQSSFLNNNQLLYNLFSNTRVYLREKGSFFCLVSDNHLLDPWGDPFWVYYSKETGEITVASLHGPSRSMYVGNNLSK